MEAQISTLDMPAQNAFCTGNFLFGVTGRTAALDDYLRPVDAALVFANGEMVLLSEREADGVLLALVCASSRSTDSPAPSTPPKLVHLSYTTSELNEPRVRANPLMRDAKLQGSPRGDQRAPSAGGVSQIVPDRGSGLGSAPIAVHDTALASVWVFGGTTVIPAHARDAVKKFVRGQRLPVGHMLMVRGLEQALPRSDLDRLLT